VKGVFLAITLIVICYPLARLFAASEQTAPTVAEVRELLQASGTGDLGSQVGPVAAQQLSIALHRANPALPARADAIVMDVVVSYLRRQAEIGHVADRLIPTYTKYLTKADVQRITEFYHSPAGQKLVSVTPAISLESAKVGQEWMESIQPGLQAKLLSRLRSEKLIE
jgi:hypothetical protein